MKERNWVLFNTVDEGGGASDGAPPAAEAVPPAAEAPESSDPTSDWTPEEWLRTDPFAEQPQERGGSTEADAGRPSAPAAPAAPAPTVDPATQSPAYQALQQQYLAMEARLAQMEARGGGPAPAGQPGSTPAGQPAQAQPRFAMQLPMPVFEALGAEDPATRYQALNAVFNALANATHAAAVKDMQEYLQNEYTPRQSQAFQTSLQQREIAGTVEREFYGKFPELRHPALRQTVVAVAQDYYRETGGPRAWNMRDGEQIGNRVRQLLQQTRPATAPSAPPPRLTGRGSRPSIDTRTMDERVMDSLLG